MNKDIRLAARLDRRNWLYNLLEGGQWHAIKKLRKGKIIKHASLRKHDGGVASTAERPDIFADYFETVQWRNLMPSLVPQGRPALGTPLGIDVSPFTLVELQTILRRLKQGKAPGGDDISPDFWRAVSDDEGATTQLLSLCQRCWNEKSLPSSWRCATVVLLFKKGDAALPQNYRPISLLAVGYKVLAALLHRKLLEGGSEQRMRASQYGFRPKRGTADALMVVRRMIDAAHQDHSEGLLLLFLDWAKAFDRVKTD